MRIQASKVIITCLAATLSVPVVLAASSDSPSGFEPSPGDGDACERDPRNQTGTLFTRVPGPPLIGLVTANYDAATATATYGGTLTRFGSTCSLTIVGKVVNVPAETFATFIGRDVAGMCIIAQEREGDCSALDTDFLEVQAAKMPDETMPGTVTIEILAVPVRAEL